MKILNASVLFTIGNISSELSQSEIFSKEAERKQQSSFSYFPFLYSQLINFHL